MTADTVVEMSKRPQPVIWILHEWWDDAMTVENLRVRNIENLTIHTVRKAMRDATMIVFVCEAQRQLYRPQAPSEIIYVGVPDPSCRYRYVQLRLRSIQESQPKLTTSPSDKSSNFGNLASKDQPTRDAPLRTSSTFATSPVASNRFVFLCLGIICPRKNQLWTIELFQVFPSTLHFHIPY